MTGGVRDAGPKDEARLVHGVAALLAELRGLPEVSLPEGAEEVCRRLVRDPDAAIVLVAERKGETDLAGLLIATLQPAVHVAGTYALIQELWVAPSARCAGVGAQLLAHLMPRLELLGVHDVEVGLPRPGFPALERTRAFYEQQGFAEVGPRMRLPRR